MATQFDDTGTFLTGANAPFIAELYERYLENPALVDDQWRLVWIDHSRALAFDRRENNQQQKMPTRFDRETIERLTALDQEVLDSLRRAPLDARQIERDRHHDSRTQQTPPDPLRPSEAA